MQAIGNTINKNDPNYPGPLETGGHSVFAALTSHILPRSLDWFEIRIPAGREVRRN